MPYMSIRPECDLTLSVLNAIQLKKCQKFVVVKQIFQPTSRIFLTMGLMGKNIINDVHSNTSDNFK